MYIPVCEHLEHTVQVTEMHSYQVSSSIYIYTSRGELVRKLVMPLGQQINDGSLDWDLTTSANLDVAYGVYFYMVDAPGVGQKFGKLAIIK